jgi:hypothetical protein
VGISLDTSQRIAGCRPAMFKNALRDYVRTLNPGNLIDFQSVFALRRDGATVFEECLGRGLVDPEAYRLPPRERSWRPLDFR